MKRYIFLTLFVVAGVLSCFSCSKRSMPSAIPSRQIHKYDSAAYDYYYLEAVKQKLMGNSAEALKYLEQCIKLNPGSDASYYQIGQILLNSNEGTKSKKYLLKAVELAPENFWYNIILAGIYYAGKNLDSTVIFYERALKYYPGKENLQITLAGIYSEMKNYEKSDELLESIDDKYGVNENSSVLLVRNYIEQKKYEKALEKVERMLELFPDNISYNALLAEIYGAKGDKDKAFEVFRKLMDKNPDDPGAQISLCDFLLNQKKYRELLDVLNSVAVNGRIMKEDKLALYGKVLENKEFIEKYGQELEVVLMVLEANYKSDDIIPLLRVDLLEKREKYVDASEVLEELVKRNPDNYFAWERLLMVYLKTEDFRKLLEKAEICATKFNRSFLAKVLYAQAAIENNKFELAFDELRKAGILAGNDREMMLQVVTMRADAYYKSGDYDKAFETFEEALKIKADDITVLNNYAYYLAEQNRNLKEAETMAESVIKKEKKNTTFLDTYAWILYKRGRLKEAEKIMESIINSGEKPDAEWFEHYGFILKRRGRCSEAVDAWRKAIMLDRSKENLKKEIEGCKR